MEDSQDQHFSEFDEYLQQTEPVRREKAAAWGIAIGLQAVDGLKPSAYLLETAKRHIEGDISIDEVKGLIDSYYRTKTGHDTPDVDTEEADKVSTNIAKLLNEKTFSFSPTGFAAVHGRIFEGVFKFAGEYRDCNLTKKEWVLRGDTVLYVGYDEIRMALEHDFNHEKEFSYQGLTIAETIRHVAKFISGIWQIHAFREGNTRATAVFAIKYLRSMGFHVGNELFQKHSWYFRNALVRANYRNVQQGIEPTLEYLELFFRNLLLNEDNELKNSKMLVNPPEQWEEQFDKHPTSTRQVPDKHPTSTRQAELVCDAPSVRAIISIIGERQLSVRQILDEMSLKNRENLWDNYLNPAIEGGWVTPLYPQNPRHPRQKYLLTVKGMAFFQKIKQLL